MADDKDVQEQTIADEQVLKKYKEAGEVVNSKSNAEEFASKNCFHASTQQFNFRVFIYQWTEVLSRDLPVTFCAEVIGAGRHVESFNFKLLSCPKFLIFNLN